MGAWAQTINDATEVYLARQDSYNKQEYRQTVSIRLPYNEAYALINEIIAVKIKSPAVADYPNENLYLKSATIIPVADDSPPDTASSGEFYLYKECEISLEYTTGLPVDDSGEPGGPARDINVDYLEVIEPRAEHQILDHNDYHWDSPPGNETLAPGQAPTKTWYGATYTVYWFNQETLPDEYFTLVGSVNQNSFTSPKLEFYNADSQQDEKFSAEPEQMLYLPAGYNESLYWLDSSLTKLGYNYVCKWLIKRGEADNTWNKYWRKTDEATNVYTFDEIVLKDDPLASPYKNYRQAVHAALLPP